MPECIIIGGGIIGLLTARSLFQQGVDVLLLEKGPLGGESSWAGGGIVSPLYPWRYDHSVNVLAERSKRIYPQLIADLQAETGLDAELLTSGLLTVTDFDADLQQWLQQWDVEAEYIDSPAAIRDIEPAAGLMVSHGLWMPDVMQVRNPRLVKALKASFEKLQIPFREQQAVDEIAIQDGRVRGVRCGDELIGADKVIIASGAWSAQFAATRQSVEVSPVKGQMIMYRGDPNLLQRIVLSEGHYVIPRKDGHILAGSTLERLGFDKSLSGQAQQELHEAAVALVPALAELPIERQWAGLRPGTEKGIPYICEHDSTPGLYIHAGHFRNGVVLGPASVELMTDLVLGREPWCDPAPYRMQAEH